MRHSEVSNKKRDDDDDRQNERNSIYIYTHINADNVHRLISSFFLCVRCIGEKSRDIQNFDEKKKNSIFVSF